MLHCGYSVDSTRVAVVWKNVTVQNGTELGTNPLPLSSG